MNYVNLDIKINTASLKDILDHLVKCNNDFEPPLSESVNLIDYCSKIYEKAVKFELWNGNQLIGLVAAYFNDIKSKNSFITNVSIIKEFQGEGQSKRLLEAVIDYAVKKVFKSISLEVNVHNKVAINLYKKYGFIIKNKKGNKYFVKKEIK